MNPGTMTGHCADCVTWWKTHFGPSCNGVGRRPDMPRMKPLSWQYARFEQWQCGQDYFNDTPYHSGIEPALARGLAEPGGN